MTVPSNKAGKVQALKRKINRAVLRPHGFGLGSRAAAPLS